MIRKLAFSFFAAAIAGCSGSVSSPAALDSRIEAARVALTQPTATVSPGTVGELGPHLRSFERMERAFDCILSIGTGAGSNCLVGSAAAGAYNLTCLTGGKVTGHMTFESHGAGGGGEVDATLEDACISDSCVTAHAVVDVVPGEPDSLATLAMTATVVRDGVTDSFSFGAEGGIGRTLLGHVVYFGADGRSLVVDGQGGTDAQGPYLVSGANQSFECTLDAEGGRCDGATEFTF